jgi:Putative MetA-pathway of phenol degradation
MIISRIVRDEWNAGRTPVALRRACLLVSLATLVPQAGARAQALPFHTETAITTGFEEEAARTFMSVLGRGGLRRNGSEVSDPMARDIDVFAQPLAVLPFAISTMWTTRVVAPFLSKSMDFTTPDGVRRSYSTTGVGDLLVDTKWVFFVRNRRGGTTRVGIEGGLIVPIGGTDARLPNGDLAPAGLQLGSGAWAFPVKALYTRTQGRLGLLANAGYRFNTEHDGFTAGDVFSYDAAVGLRLLPSRYKSMQDDTFVFYLEVNGTVARRDQVTAGSVADSGGHLLFLSPDLQWIPTPWLLFESSVQFPIVQDLNGTQLGYDTRFQLGGRIRFSFFR